MPLTFKEMNELVNYLPKEYRNASYREVTIGFDTFVLKNIDYYLICYLERENNSHIKCLKWIKGYSWKTPEFNETLYEAPTM